MNNSQPFIQNQPSTEPLVWIDCEMTGLDPEKDSILEIFCLITDHNLNLLDDSGLGLVIHHDSEILKQQMTDDWVIKTHGASGLTSRVLASNISAEEAADRLLSYVQYHVPDKRKALLAGNSVHADKSFLVKEPYKKVIEHLHYRILDISSIKEAVKRWHPELLPEMPVKEYRHTAKEDILESIAEAQFYRERLFKRQSPSSEK